MKNAKAAATKTGDESYDPGRLEFDTTYFWRVDSVAKGKAKPAVTDGLVGWWKMDDAAGETVADSSGKGNNGKVFGATKWGKGHVGKGSLEITNYQEGENLTSGGVTIPDSPMLRPSRFTVAMWVKFTEVAKQKAMARVFQKGNDNTETMIILGGGGADNRGNSNPAIAFAMATETRGDVHSVKAPGQFAGGKWYHVAASYDGSDMVLYVDGKVAAKKTIGQIELVAVEGEPLIIGNRAPNMDRGFYGDVDDVRMYKASSTVLKARYLKVIFGALALSRAKLKIHRRVRH
ncbi:MAG: LamG domain-containing protein [Planctomycetota bacterium]